MNGFMRKVYIIVSIKLALTALICVMALKSEWFKNTFASVPFIVLLALLLVGLIIVMVCLPDFFKKFTMPISIVFIIVFALLISVICASAQSESILAAIVISAVAVIGLTIYSCNIAQRYRFHQDRFNGLQGVLVCICADCMRLWNYVHLLEESSRALIVRLLGCPSLLYFHNFRNLENNSHGFEYIRYQKCLLRCRLHIRRFDPYPSAGYVPMHHLSSVLINI